MQLRNTSDKPYYSLNDYLLENFGEKLYKLSLDGGMTCPNRDGQIDTRGCIFCSSEHGSGDFAASRTLSITDQIETAKEKVAGKFSGSHYIAYFQAFTNTYADVSYLFHTPGEVANHINPIKRPTAIATRLMEISLRFKIKNATKVNLPRFCSVFVFFFDFNNRFRCFRNDV